VYFGDIAELTDKIDFYSRNDAERRKIAAAGYRRCIGSGYQYVDRARAALKVVNEMAGGVAP
jgi:spore maturation protein CgeB